MQSWISVILIVTRTVSITLGFGAMGLCIALDVAPGMNLGISIPATFCCAGIGAFGLIALYAICMKGEAFWILAMIMDALVLFFAVAACALLTVATTGNYIFEPFHEHPELLYPAVVFVYICLILSILSMIQSARSRPRIHQTATENYDATHHNAEYYPSQEEQYPKPYEDNHQVRRHDSYLDSKDANDRPASIAETTADWSVVGTLTRGPSTVYSEHQRPPSYASPKPSRTPSTIPRKPLT